MTPGRHHRRAFLSTSHGLHSWFRDSIEPACSGHSKTRVVYDRLQPAHRVGSGSRRPMVPGLNERPPG